MFAAIKNIHVISVIAFLLLYFIKTILLISGKEDALTKITKSTRIPEMIVSFVFLATGIYLLIEIPQIKPLLIVKIGLVFMSIPIAIIGFKKRNKILGALALVMITASYGLAEMAGKNKAVVSTENAAGLANGADLYSSNCALCHGDNGKAGIMGAADLSMTKASTDSIKNTVLNGKGTMAKIEGLTPDQAAAIADYVEKNLKGK